MVDLGHKPIAQIDLRSRVDWCLSWDIPKNSEVGMRRNSRFILSFSLLWSIVYMLSLSQSCILGDEFLDHSEIAGCDRTKRQKTTQKSKMRYLADIFPTWIMWWPCRITWCKQTSKPVKMPSGLLRFNKQKWDRQDNVWAVRRQELRLSRLFDQKMRKMFPTKWASILEANQKHQDHVPPAG